MNIKNNQKGNRMNNWITFLSPIATALITGFITFQCTKYKNNFDREKLEKGYDRFYYPIMKMIRNDNSIEEIRQKTITLLNTYNKYIDTPTVKLANAFINATEKHRIKKFEQFENNIILNNYMLRRKLGYYESSYWLRIQYFSAWQVLNLFFVILILVFTIIGIIYSISLGLNGESGKSLTFSFYFTLFLILIYITIETILIITNFLKKHINYLFNILRNIIFKVKNFVTKKC